MTEILDGLSTEEIQALMQAIGRRYDAQRKAMDRDTPTGGEEFSANSITSVEQLRAMGFATD